MANINDLWYAAKKTHIVYMPHKLLETFGETSVHYSLVTELEGGRLKLRTGVVKAARPRIVTPHYLASQALENFGEEARKYFEDLLARKEGAGILQYGLTFEKQDFGEEEVGGVLEEVADQIARTAEDNPNEVRGVLIGMEQFWEIALVFFLRKLVSQSVPVNVRELAGQGLFALKNGVPAAVHAEIQQDFQACFSKEQADRLGDKLRDYGLFDQYEDQFFALYEHFV